MKEDVVGVGGCCYDNDGKKGYKMKI